MTFWKFKKNKQQDETIEETIIEPTLVGRDLGYGQDKSSKGFRPGDQIKFISAVGTPISDFGRTTATVTDQELLDSLTVTVNGKTYYVGRNAIVNTRNGRLTLRQNKADDEHNMIKFITGLALFTDTFQEYAEFDIVTGLPVLEFKNQSAALEAMMKNGGQPFVFTMHYGPIEVKKQIKVNNVKIVSQGEGAFYDFILDETGNIIEEHAEIVGGTVMVVDVGYRTTDIVSMENGRYIEPLSDQINKGVNTMHQEILRLIMERLGIKKELRDIDQIVRSGVLYHNTKEYDISKIIDDAAVPFAEDIVESLHTISNDQLGGVNHIIFTGGGAQIIYPFAMALLQGIVNTSVMGNSEFCNANGYYKYGLLLKNAQKAAEQDA